MSLGVQAQWDPRDYGEMLASLIDVGRRFSAATAPQSSDSDGAIWLRHDVELSLSAAVASAIIESSKAVTATYFLCTESPFLVNDPTTVDVVRQLIDLGHNVGVHVVCAPDDRLDRVCRLRDRASEQLGLADEPAVTLHCPGQRDPLALLAMCPTPSVYTSYATDGWDYVSDATGRWRYGSPVERLTGPDRRPAQLLTHPFWWTKGSSITLDVATNDRRAFLPQYFGATSVSTAGA
jgi:hypothetical protein